MDKLSKTMTDKIDKVTLPIRLDIQLSPKVSETTKTLTEKLSGQEKSLNEKISSCQKTLTDKISAQEKSVKDVTDKIGVNTLSQNSLSSFKHLFILQRSWTAAQRQILPPRLSWSHWQKPLTAFRRTPRALKIWVGRNWKYENVEIARKGRCIFVVSSKRDEDRVCHSQRLGKAEVSTLRPLDIETFVPEVSWAKGEWVWIPTMPQWGRSWTA